MKKQKPKLSPRARFYLLTIERLDLRRAAKRTTPEEEARVAGDLEHAWDRLTDPEREHITEVRAARAAAAEAAAAAADEPKPEEGA